MKNALVKAGYTLDTAVPTTCHYCNSKVEFTTNDEIYGRLYGVWPYVYKCTYCDAYVGVHQNTEVPLGTLADKPTREARKQVKPLFNELWQDGSMKRTEAYGWLAKRMGISASQCHFGMFNVDDCNKARAILKGLPKP